MVMSQNVTFLSLCSLILIYYFKNGPNVTVNISNNKYTKFYRPILFYTNIIQENVIFDFSQMSTLDPTFFIIPILKTRYYKRGSQGFKS